MQKTQKYFPVNVKNTEGGKDDSDDEDDNRDGDIYSVDVGNDKELTNSLNSESEPIDCTDSSVVLDYVFRGVECDDMSLYEMALRTDVVSTTEAKMSRYR